MIEPDGTSVCLKLLVLKTRQMESLLAFYQTIRQEIATFCTFRKKPTF